MIAVPSFLSLENEKSSGKQKVVEVFFDMTNLNNYLL
jgi:hypothetical protein